MKLKLKKLRDERRWTQEYVAAQLGISTPYYNRLETGKRTVSSKYLNRLANLYNCEVPELWANAKDVTQLTQEVHSIEVYGDVQAGLWAESCEWPEPDRYSVVIPALPREISKAFGLRVRGESMNREYPDGSVVICVRLFDFYRDIKNGDHVIIHRKSSDGMFEATIKEVQQDDDDRVWLWPRSDHPEHQQPISVPWPPNGEEHEPEIEIHAIVVGDYRPRKL